MANSTDLNVTAVLPSGLPFDLPGDGARVSDGGPPPASLDDLKAAMGVLLVPQHLPEGYAFQRGQLMQGRYPSLLYKGPSVPVDFSIPIPGPADGRPTEMAALITVSQYAHADIKVGSGYARNVSVRGTTGHLVQGGWGRVLRQGSLVWSGWAPGAARSLYFEHEGIIVAVVAEPANAVTDEALIQVAESLQPH